MGSGNVAAVADVTNPDGPVSGAGAGNEVAGKAPRKYVFDVASLVSVRRHDRVTQ